MLKVIKDLGILDINPTTGKKLKAKKRYCICQCPVCLKEFSTMYSNNKRGTVSMCKSCSVTKKNFKHGNTVRGKVTTLYRRWLAMRDRCNNPNNTHYHRYGGRGISVCSTWDDFNVFKTWAEEAGYKKELTIDRINVDGNYEPNNCRYVGINIQSANVNKRPNNTSGYKGVVRNGVNWSAQIGTENNKVYLGTFKTIEEAANAYNNYVIENNLPHPLSKEE
jgi:hypothetical protein